jgi:hypothetical protein
MNDYFDPDLSDEDMSRLVPEAMETTASFQANAVRSELVRRGLEQNNFVWYCCKRFDLRWLYWEAEVGLLDRGRPEYSPHVFAENIWLEARQRQPKDVFDRGYVKPQPYGQPATW